MQSFLLAIVFQYLLQRGLGTDTLSVYCPLSGVRFPLDSQGHKDDASLPVCMILRYQTYQSIYHHPLCRLQVTGSLSVTRSFLPLWSLGSSCALCVVQVLSFGSCAQLMEQSNHSIREPPYRTCAALEMFALTIWPG